MGALGIINNKVLTGEKKPGHNYDNNNFVVEKRKKQTNIQASTDTKIRNVPGRRYGGTAAAAAGLDGSTNNAEMIATTERVVHIVHSIYLGLEETQAPVASLL